MRSHAAHRPHVAVAEDAILQRGRLHPLISLQQRAGNRAVSTLVQRLVVQRANEDESVDDEQATPGEDSGPSFDPETAVTELAAGAEIVGGASEGVDETGEATDSGAELQALAVQRQGAGSSEVDIGKVVEAIFKAEPFKSFKERLEEKAKKLWKDLSMGVKVPAIVVAGAGALSGLGISYGRPGGVPPFRGGISTPAIPLYESPAFKIKLEFSGKASGGQWEGSAILKGEF